MSPQLTQPLTLSPLQHALTQSVPEIHHSDQGVQSLSTAYVSTLISYGIEISLAYRGSPWDNDYAEFCLHEGDAHDKDAPPVPIYRISVLRERVKRGNQRLDWRNWRIWRG